MNRASFYKALRRSGIPGFTRLSQSQVNGIEAILNAFETHGGGKIKVLAYALATARREVGPGMVPVREGFKKTDAQARAFVRRQGRAYARVVNGHVYYGRGLVQLTWFENYKKEGIANNPDRALDLNFSTSLLFRGLRDGRWNSRRKGIEFYLPDDGPDDLKNARRTVNITDHWATVADYYRRFVLAIVEAGGV